MAKRVVTRRKGPTLVQRSRRLSPQQKAWIHERAGAGTSKVRRPFLALTDAEAAFIGDAIDKGILEQLNRDPV